ncbi:MAG: histidine phosphatase family protein [Aeromicrobium sp.]|nr:histidine phosphatase family protein [Burkholderiales bacterium]
MELVLWRHAEAEDDAATDHLRNLTPKGRKQAKKMADWFASQIGRQWGDWKLIASPANRAQQTAEALGQPFATLLQIAPDAPVSAILTAVNWPGGHSDVKVLVVGHQPTLGMVAAQLIDGGGGYVSVKKGAMWWFETRERDGTIKTTLKAMVTPDSV